MRPWILVDVDGVLNPDIRHDLAAQQPPFCDCHSDWVKRTGRPNGHPFPLLLNPGHGEMLLSLAAATGGELAWGSTWEHHANEWIGPEIGLPALPVGITHSRSDRSKYMKAHNLVPWTGGRPFVWFDDDSTELAEAARLATQPCLCIEVDDRTGLTGKHIATAKKWLLANGGTT
jgi:HAD domain in Swiss Army Knife RNA repair proteins